LGVSPGDCPTEVAIACWPWGTYLGEDATEEGVDVLVSSWRKYASSQIPTTVKTTGMYVNSLLAGEEARSNGYAEALMLNKEGNVAEGPGENLFLVRDGQLYTPGIAESILDGITRNAIVQLARDLGYPVDDSATISRGELYAADELFFTGTAAEVTPIRRVDNVTIGDGGRGPITEEIQSRFFDVVYRRTDAYEDWFTYV
ncbi:MAG: branched-chain amino acid transaminase, partial [Halobacteriota archaeon]